MMPDEPLMVLPESTLRTAKRQSAKRGHAAPPGSGPEGETCKSCAHLSRKSMARTFLKCGLMAARWSSGERTDVRARDPACSKWEPRI